MSLATPVCACVTWFNVIVVQFGLCSRIRLNLPLLSHYLQLLFEWVCLGIKLTLVLSERWNLGGEACGYWSSLLLEKKYNRHRHAPASCFKLVISVGPKVDIRQTFYITVCVLFLKPWIELHGLICFLVRHCGNVNKFCIRRNGILSVFFIFSL